MANNFGALNNTILINDAFDSFVADLPPLFNLTCDVTDEAGGRYAKPGETITIKDWSAPINAYNVDPAVGYQAPDYAARPDTTVTLPNNVIAVSFGLTSAEYRLLDSGASHGAAYDTFLMKIKEKMQEGIGLRMVGDFHGMIDGAAYTHKFISAPGTFNRASEVDLDTDFFGRRVSRIAPNCVMPGVTFGEWTKDHQIIQNFTGQDQSARLMDGGIKSIVSNFTFWRTNVSMPATAPRGYACTKTGAIFVSRIPDEPTTGDRDPVSLAEVVNDKTKVAILSRLWKNAKTGSIQMDLATIYAFKKGQDECMELIVPA